MRDICSQIRNALFEFLSRHVNVRKCVFDHCVIVFRNIELLHELRIDMNKAKITNRRRNLVAVYYLDDPQSFDRILAYVLECSNGA